MLEAKAIMDGLEAISRETSNGEDETTVLYLVVEVDSNKVVDALNESSEDLSKMAMIVKEIEELSSGKNLLFSKCSRMSNSMTHNLARVDLKFGDFVSFFGRTKRDAWVLGMKGSLFG